MMHYIKMKKEEIKWKLTVYTCLNKIVAEHKTILDSVTKLYRSFAGESADDIKEAFINSLVELIHNQAQKDGEGYDH